MSLYAELKRRNVFRVAAAYIVVGWLILQLADIVLNFITAPDWVGKAIIALLVLGFMPALAVAWIFEVTDDGVVRDDGTGHGNGHRAKRLDIITLVAVVIVAVMVFWQHLQPAPPVEEQPERVSRAAPAVAGPEASAPTAVIEITPNSIAVLPFTNRSAEDDNQYFVDGVHDDLLTQLARIGDLKVISRTSVMEYRDTTKNMRQIGQELGVATILEGAVQRAGNRVRINAQLIDSQTDEHLWADTFDRELTAANIFDIQSDIARAIASALASTLSPEQVDQAVSDAPPTTDDEALDLYLQARAQSELYDEPSILTRIALYRRAVAQDPQFALAMGELGYELNNHAWFFTKDPAEFEEGARWIERALSIAPDEPRLHWTMADHLYHGQLDYAGALHELDIAQRGMPGSAEVYALRGWILRRSGDLQGGIDALRHAVQLDPRNAFVLGDLMLSYGYQRDMREVRAWSRRMGLIPGVPSQYMYYAPLAELGVAANREPMRRFLTQYDGNESGVGEEQVVLPIMDGDWAAAEAAVQRIANDPAVFQWHVWPKSYMRARIALASGDADAVARYAAQGLRDSEAYIATHPEDARGVATRAQCLAMLGRGDEARAEAQRARSMYPPERDKLGASNFVWDELVVLAMIAPSSEVAAAAERFINGYGALISYDGMMLYPEFQQHRDSPAFRDLAARYSRDWSTE